MLAASRSANVVLKGKTEESTVCRLHSKEANKEIHLCFEFLGKNLQKSKTRVFVYQRFPQLHFSKNK